MNKYHRVCEVIAVLESALPAQLYDDMLTVLPFHPLFETARRFGFKCRITANYPFFKNFADINPVININFIEFEFHVSQIFGYGDVLDGFRWDAKVPTSLQVQLQCCCLFV